MCSRLRFRVRPSLPFSHIPLTPSTSLSFIGTAARATGLSARTKPSLGMLASLDHAMYFYEDDVDVSDFLLFYMECGVVRSGRGLVSGRMYKRDGTLVLACVSRLLFEVEEEADAAGSFRSNKKVSCALRCNGLSSGNTNGVHDPGDPQREPKCSRVEPRASWIRKSWRVSRVSRCESTLARRQADSSTCEASVSRPLPALEINPLVFCSASRSCSKLYPQVAKVVVSLRDTSRQGASGSSKVRFVPSAAGQLVERFSF